MDILTEKEVTSIGTVTPNSLIHGDCLQGMDKLFSGGVTVDLILTDIPYDEVNRKSNGLRNLDKDLSLIHI